LVGDTEGESDGAALGAFEMVGDTERAALGDKDGCLEGELVGIDVGASEGDVDGSQVAPYPVFPDFLHPLTELSVCE